MKLRIVSAMLILAAGALGQATQTAPPAAQPTPTLASAIDREISAIEKQVLDAAEAMPEDKFNFSPESLNLPGANYKGVRSFAVQVKHIAASNYFLWSGLTGDKLPANLKDGNGPEDIKTKADILAFLKDSFALGHKAAAIVDHRKHAADARTRQIHAPAPRHLRRRPRLQSLWTDGGVFADERNRATRQPGKVTSEKQGCL